MSEFYYILVHISQRAKLGRGVCYRCAACLRSAGCRRCAPPIEPGPKASLATTAPRWRSSRWWTWLRILCHRPPHSSRGTRGADLVESASRGGVRKPRPSIIRQRQRSARLHPISIRSLNDSVCLLPRTLTLDICIFLRHPCVPLVACLHTVALQPTP